MHHLGNHNADPKPFIWSKSTSQILEKVSRAKQALKSDHSPTVARLFTSRPVSPPILIGGLKAKRKIFEWLPYLVHLIRPRPLIFPLAM